MGFETKAKPFPGEGLGGKLLGLWPWPTEGGLCWCGFWPVGSGWDWEWKWEKSFQLVKGDQFRVLKNAHMYAKVHRQQSNYLKKVLSKSTRQVFGRPICLSLTDFNQSD